MVINVTRQYIYWKFYDYESEWKSRISLFIVPSSIEMIFVLVIQLAACTMNTSYVIANNQRTKLALVFSFLSFPSKSYIKSFSFALAN